MAHHILKAEVNSKSRTIQQAPGSMCVTREWQTQRPQSSAQVWDTSLANNNVAALQGKLHVWQLLSYPSPAGALKLMSTSASLVEEGPVQVRIMLMCTVAIQLFLMKVGKIYIFIYQFFINQFVLIIKHKIISVEQFRKSYLELWGNKIMWLFNNKWSVHNIYCFLDP